MGEDLNKAVGQLIVGRIGSVSLEPELCQMLQNGTIGGITLFKENVENLTQLVNLIESVWRQSCITPLLAVDQEGGVVQRLDQVISPLPSAMALGNLNCLETTKKITSLSGEQLRLLGINVVLAPVLDVNTNILNPIIGTRSFGEKPDIVARHAKAVIMAYIQEGVLPVGKHFPGHGDTQQDSHLSLPKLSCPSVRLEQRELVPFCQCLPFLPAVLTGHIWVEAFDRKPLPASLSQKITTYLLREKLGFEGLVFTDDMLMKAITNEWGLGEACVQAVLAGADQLLICATAKELALVHGALVKAVKNGQISEARLQESLERRKQATNSMEFNRKELLKLGSATIRQKKLEHLIHSSKQMLLDVSSAAIKVTNGSLTQAFSCPELVFFVPDHPRYSLAFVSGIEKPGLFSGKIFIEHRYSLCPNRQEIEELTRLCSGKPCVLFTFRSALHKGQLELAKALRCNGQLLVATEVPYDLALVDGWKNAVALYDPSDLAMEAFIQKVKLQFSNTVH